LPDGLVKNGLPREQAVLLSHIEKVLRNGQNGPFSGDNIYFVAEESKCFFKLFTNNNSKLSKKALDKEFNESLPGKINDYKYLYQILLGSNYSNKKDKRILGLAIDVDYLETWTNVFKKFSLKINLFIPELIASKVVHRSRDENYFLCNFSKSLFSVSFFSEGQLHYRSVKKIEENFQEIYESISKSKIDLNKMNRNTNTVHIIFEDVILELEKAIHFSINEVNKNVDALFFCGLDFLNNSFEHFVKKETDNQVKKINKLEFLAGESKQNFLLSFGAANCDPFKEKLVYKNEQSVLKGIFKYFNLL